VYPSFRMGPSHKSVIVEALQKQGNIVGMLGEGVNDAITLKLADIGIAMGSGTDVCKEDSKMVDDNFGTILADRGESIFSGIKKYLDSKSLQVFLLSQ
jgi:Ca2+-transporting ATPase